MIVRLIFYLLLIYIAVRLIRRIIAPMQTKKVKKADETEEMVKDPECGIYIPEKDALVKKIKGQRYAFCSEECHRKYKEKLN